MATGYMQSYDQPTNPGRGLFGRGRIPTGRGQMMSGRTMAMSGRGGRGGMMPAWGRGGRGRMIPARGVGGRGNRGGRGIMAPARGRGGRIMMPDRGGRGGTVKSIPSKLDIFNRYVSFNIKGFCDRADHENLGFAFPQFTPAPLNQQQLQMRMKKIAENKKELQNPYGIKDMDLDDETDVVDGNEIDTPDDIKKISDVATKGTVENADENQNEKCIASGKKEPFDENKTVTDNKEKKNANKKDQEMENINDLKSQQVAIETEMDPAKKKQMMKEREERMRINMTDCHTLLARLNTKRLYRRIKYFKRKDPNYDVDKAYAYNKDTVEISKIEWEALIEDYKVRLVKLREKQAIEEAAKVGKKAAYRKKSKKSKKNKRKKKRGKVNKMEKFRTATDDVSGGVEDASLTEENDAENGSNSDDDVNESISDSDDENTDGQDFLYVGDKPSKYEMLMFTPCPRAVAVLASYPRSGNSLMRNLYEKITLRVTGSDMMGGLQKHDLVGEMATGTNNVQFVKTHYPERMGHPAFAVSRAVLLVRNPYDAMDSYFNLMSTSTHTTSLSPEARKKYAKLFGDMALKEILVWRDFHEYWLKQKIPLLVVRYEDLIRDTVRVIKKVIRFVLEINSMTFFEDRIQRAIGEEEVEKLGPYKARSGGIGKSLMKGNYTPQLLHQINYGIVGTMEKFGYKEMLIPNPKSWKLEPIDDWGVYIPGTSTEPMIINQKGLVRGPNRQTNWQQVKMIMQKDKREAKENAEGNVVPKKVNLL